MPDFFHVMHDLVKSYSLAIGRRCATSAAGTHESPGGSGTTPGTAPRGSQDAPAAQALVEARQAEVTALGRGAPAPIGTTWRPSRSRCIPSVSRTRLPRPPPRSTSQLQATVDAIEVFAQGHQLPVRHAAMTKVRKQLPALAALVDFWWEGVDQDLAALPPSRPVAAVG